MSNRIVTRKELAGEIVASALKRRDENPTFTNEELRLLCYLMMRMTGDIREELQEAFIEAGIAS